MNGASRGGRALLGARATAALLGIAVTGCPSGSPARPRTWAHCTCDYVTDMDQPGHSAVDVCSDDPDPHGAAESCARGSGVGAVTACRCDPARPSACDARETCRAPGPPK